MAASNGPMIPRSRRVQWMVLGVTAVAFLGAAAFFAWPMFTGGCKGYATQTAQSEVQNICEAVRQYVIRNGSLPDTLIPLVTRDEDGIAFLEDQTGIPLDPWGRPYCYLPNPDGRHFEVATLGRDGELGGDGEDADVSNRTIRR